MGSFLSYIAFHTYLTFSFLYDILISLDDISGGHMEKVIKILTDPISNRIIQLIRKNKKMTVSEILTATPDIPRATVYRRIEKMSAAELIEVVETHKVRGQNENTYAIKDIYITLHSINICRTWYWNNAILNMPSKYNLSRTLSIFVS